MVSGNLLVDNGSRCYQVIGLDKIKLSYISTTCHMHIHTNITCVVDGIN